MGISLAGRTPQPLSGDETGKKHKEKEEPKIH
jgi:hypothetical protein